MKRIKAWIAVLAVLWISVAQAQEKEIDLFTIPLSSPSKEGMLKVEQLSGSINVIAYEGKEVIVKVMVGEVENSGQSKYGMKRIGGSGLSISAEEENNVVKIDNEAWNRKTDFEIKVPKNFSLKLKTVNDGDIYVEGVSGDMEISNVNGHITLKNVSGSAITDTTNGEVKVNFNSVKEDSDMAFSSFNGNVEVTFPSMIKANVKAKSDMGEIYSDFNMAISEREPKVEKGQSARGYKVKIEQWLRGTINGGGPEILFKTFNGDILIKSK
ncbi:hypothetical protein GTQ34_12590 [Muricauda sp. JGD-17]|uniref:DUF4097 domain-containing protein n=1 Tax=Flagellimonas ochracea TaxID=2696472 RepID=A0A964WY43_9FLAO|nr:DUF4097 family beta strand repeat-containing protein [Allomuricauda ochracea]NAY92755.1 hypothetical protein [Allomuricauda ochracea]